MSKKVYLGICMSVALIVLLSVSVLKGAAQDNFGEKPTPIPAKELIPAPTPEDNREIAILTLAIISSPEGKIETINLERGRILKGYAPNVLGMTGEWTVELVGSQQTVKYGVLDPRHAEVENEQNADQPFTYTYETNYVWDLVVPLFDDGKDMEIREINIYDAEGSQIFRTTVDREGWQK